MCSKGEINKIIKELSHKPILIGGRAIKYYCKKRQSDDWDFIIHKSDIKNIKIENAEKILGGYKIFKKGMEIDYMTEKYGYTYNDLKKTAIELDDYYIASREMLIVLKAQMVADPDNGPNHVIRKAIDDIYLLGKKCELWKIGY